MWNSYDHALNIALALPHLKVQTIWFSLDSMKSEYKYRVKLSSESSFKIMIQFDMFLPSKINEFEKKNYQTKIYVLANKLMYV